MAEVKVVKALRVVPSPVLQLSDDGKKVTTTRVERQGLHNILLR